MIVYYLGDKEVMSLILWRTEPIEAKYYWSESSTLGGRTMANVIINNKIEEKPYPDPVLLKNVEIIPTFETEIENGVVHTALLRVEAQDLRWFPSKANPRSYNEGGSTTKKIKKTLEVEPDLFEVLNRGITVVCDSLKYKDGEVIFNFSSWSQGVVDGGHTMTTAIKTVKTDEDIPSNHAKVTIKVMYGPGVVSLASRISETYNTVEKVSQMSMNNLRGYFDPIKEVLKPFSYFSYIKWEQNEKGCRISCNRIIGLLNSFDPKRWGQNSGIVSQPTDSYNSASHTQLDVQKQYETKGFTVENPYYALSKVTGQIVELFEWAEHNFPMLYEKNNPGKKYIRLEVTLPTGRKANLSSLTESGVTVKGEDGEKRIVYKTYFHGDTLPSYVPTSLIYAIIAPMRKLLERDKNGFYYFIMDPIKMFEIVGPAVVTRAINFYPKTWDPYNMMKDPNFWAALESVTIEEMNKLK